ncbi:NFATC2-interacting protein [Cyprinodon tularosa]|uniref:NFATC2-interacting protein n=1 Tax=Cyprinodon tularosa TaxID=77115 RepID=UPI0018E1FFF2|nr:NFATC2-interacting protein [Cyprinodon tularosa]
MAETVSSSDLQERRPPPKRRRVLNPAAIVPVPVYSSKVSSGLRLKPTAALLCGSERSDDGAKESLRSEFSSAAPPVELLDSEDEAEPLHQSQHSERLASRRSPRCPSPPPPQSPVQKQSVQTRRKISEIDRKLRAISSTLSPRPQHRKTRRSGTDSDDGDDVIMLSPGPSSDPLREIPLKIRYRTDVHKVLVLPSTQLSEVVAQLSVSLKVPPHRLQLLREDRELPSESTVAQLGLSIADIIDCLVTSSEDPDGSSSAVRVKLQSKDRDSSQEFSIQREAPLSSIFSQYLSGLPAGAARKVRFHFDGSKVTGSQTAAQLDLEDGDIIEVWT